MAVTLKKHGERGIALIVVLCMTSVMVGASVQMISQTRRETAETADLGDGLRSLYLAPSADSSLKRAEMVSASAQEEFRLSQS